MSLSEKEKTKFEINDVITNLTIVFLYRTETVTIYTDAPLQCVFYLNSYHADTKHWQFFPFWLLPFEVETKKKKCLNSFFFVSALKTTKSTSGLVIDQHRGWGDDKKFILIAPIYRFGEFDWHWRCTQGNWSLFVCYSRLYFNKDKVKLLTVFFFYYRT